MNKLQNTAAFQDRDHGNLLEALKEAQRKYGYLSGEVIAEVAQSLNVPVNVVYGVATFYSFLSTRPLGRNVIRVCKSLPCYLKDSQVIIKSVGADKGKDFIDALEELPAEAIQGKPPWPIEAYWNRIDEVVKLYVTGTVAELKEIKFKRLKDFKAVKRSKYELEFNYKNWRYKLEKSFESACLP